MGARAAWVCVIDGSVGHRKASGVSSSDSYKRGGRGGPDRSPQVGMWELAVYGKSRYGLPAGDG